MLGEIDIRIVTGPDDYLLGEEKALLEVIEGRRPAAATTAAVSGGAAHRMASGVGSGSVGWDATYNPTVVNNVETLSHVPHILAKGADWFRSSARGLPGPWCSPCQVTWSRGVVELPMGTPLRSWSTARRRVRSGTPVDFVFSGASNAPIPVPTSRRADGLRVDVRGRLGSGIGRHDRRRRHAFCRCVRRRCSPTFSPSSHAANARPANSERPGSVSRPRPGLSSGPVTRHLDEIAGWLGRVTDANRCGLGAGPAPGGRAAGRFLLPCCRAPVGSSLRPASGLCRWRSSSTSCPKRDASSSTRDIRTDEAEVGRRTGRKSVVALLAGVGHWAGSRTGGRK
jgi:NADH-quinone oxidoreductase subunit F